jgi:MFS transporter, MHS family, proline/betaine transporter
LVKIRYINIQKFTTRSTPRFHEILLAYPQLILLIKMKIKPSSLTHIAITANVLDWYDFSISAFLAIVLGRLFFAGHDDVTALIQSFAIFAASYLMRPLGSVIFGYIGNKKGAGVALQWSTLLMAIPTIFIGLLPTYRDIGYTAPVLLIMLKLIQGLATGGELPTSAYYVASQAHHSKKGIMSALVAASSISGMLFASLLAFLLSHLFSDREIEDWAWRIPFLLSAPLFLIILKIRSGMIDHGVASAEPYNKSRVRISTRLNVFVRGALLVAAMNVGFYTLLIWLPSYVEIFLKYARSDAYLSNTLALACYVVAILTSGFFSRIVSYKKILIASLWSITVLAYPLFVLLLHIHAFALLLLVQCVFALLYGSICGVMWFTLYNLFKDNWKNFGLAITFTIPTTLFGGTAPLVCTYLVRQFDDLSFPAFYIVLFTLLALPAAYGLNDSDQNAYSRNTAMG